jgi:phosphate transport system permease protein
MGETAPLLFTVSYTMNITGSPNTLMNTLPVQIFNDIKNPEPAIQARAWGAALTLVALVLILNLIARAVSRRSRIA